MKKIIEETETKFGYTEEEYKKLLSLYPHLGPELPEHHMNRSRQEAWLRQRYTKDLREGKIK